jgi:hypothetical protein
VNPAGAGVYATPRGRRAAPVTHVPRETMTSPVHPRRALRTACILALAGAAAACTGGTADGASAVPAAGDAPRQASAAAAHAGEPGAEQAEMVVYKSPHCGCCQVWVDYVEEAGFRVVSHDVMDVQPIKAHHGLPGHLSSCHTTLVGGYVVEGHVPADVIRRLLAERPDIAGIAVPGMPLGSPGMEVPSGRKDPYDIIAFTRDGRVSVYDSR